MRKRCTDGGSVFGFSKSIRGSILVSGYSTFHEELERKLLKLKVKEVTNSSLFFSFDGSSCVRCRNLTGVNTPSIQLHAGSLW